MNPFLHLVFAHKRALRLMEARALVAVDRTIKLFVFEKQTIMYT
jgi:hypothetical protein